MRETRTIEFKETITNTFLKTVSAFSNYNGGEIYFGIDDNGNVKGIADVKQSCLHIENKIKTFQNIFNMPQTGIVDLATWYQISQIYVALEKLAE